jgi:hypothetical protein
MITNFAKILTPILKALLGNDYPVLSTRLFFTVWIEWMLNSGLRLFPEKSNGFIKKPYPFDRASHHTQKAPQTANSVLKIVKARQF